jgi:SAM-dependent methyltransferase
MNRIRRTLKRYYLTANTIRYAVEYRCIRKCFPFIPGRPDLLLDAGAGSGEMSLKLIEEGFCQRILGVEPDERNYAVLVANWRSLPNTITLQGRLENLPVETSSVDVALCSQVLEHIADDRLAATELARVLKLDGHAIVSVPHPPPPVHDPAHVRPGYTQKDLDALLKPAGFERLYTEYFLTQPTFRRLTTSKRIPFPFKLFLTVAWADRERLMSPEQKKELQPYGMTCLYRKGDPSRSE